MLKKIKPPDSRNYFFAALLIFSIVLHVVVLTQLQWQLKIPIAPEVIFEVQLLEPQKKVVKPKPVQPKPIQPKPVQPQPVQPKPVQPKPAVIKKLILRKKPTVEKPPLLKKQTAPVPKTSSSAPSVKPVPKPVPKPAPKPAPKPVPKPSLSITSDVSQSDSLKENGFSAGRLPPRAPSSRPLISRIEVPESTVADQLPVVADPPPAPSLLADSGDPQRSAPMEDLDSRQIAESNLQTDIKTEIKSQKEAVRFRIVEQQGDGKTQTIEADEAGESMIEGELKQRKVIYKPDPPVINLERDVTITLKFTVLPNGEVDQIFPYRRAEPKLERLAMQLLRQYRFEPLFENDKVQHGIIHFSIYRSEL